MTDARLQVGHSLLFSLPPFRVLLAWKQATTHLAALQAYQQVYAWTEADPAFEAAAKENIDMFCFETTLKVKEEAVQRSIRRVAHGSPHECGMWHSAFV